MDEKKKKKATRGMLLQDPSAVFLVLRLYAAAPICVSCMRKCFAHTDVSQGNMTSLSNYVYLSQLWKAEVEVNRSVRKIMPPTFYCSEQHEFRDRKETAYGK